MLLLLVGGLAVATSFTPIAGDIFQAKGLRAIGFCCLFLGLGEYLNHPVEKGPAADKRSATDTPATPYRSRNPCGLGNTLDVLAVICLFIAVSYLFFPYQR